MQIAFLSRSISLCGWGWGLHSMRLFAEVWLRSSASNSHSPFWRECGHLRDDYFSQIWFVSNKVIRKNYKYLMISPAKDGHEKPLQATHCGRPTKTKGDLSPRRKKRYIFVNIFTVYKRNPVPPNYSGLISTTPCWQHDNRRCDLRGMQRGLPGNFLLTTVL